MNNYIVFFHNINMYLKRRLLINKFKKFMKNNKFYPFLLAILILFTAACSKEKDPITGKIKRYEPNVSKKVEAADGIFFNKKNSGGTTYDFATSNVLWRASLDTISFMPLSNVSYSGGVITTDWYGDAKSKEQIKINIRFLSDKLETASVVVTGFKRICDTVNNCTTKPTENTINQPIKDKILQKARELSLKDKAKK